MKSILFRLIQALRIIRRQEAAQREFIHAVYRRNSLSYDYRKPTFLRAGGQVRWS